MAKGGRHLSRSRRATVKRIIRARQASEAARIRGMAPASDVKVTKADGTVEIVPTKRPLSDR